MQGLMQVIAICQLQHLITRACQGITDVGMNVCLSVCVLVSLCKICK